MNRPSSSSAHADQSIVDIHQQTTPETRKRPNLDLLEGIREEYIKVGVPLYEAAIKGDWKAAQRILNKNEGNRLMRSAITQNHDTLLHVAASAERTNAVKEFVKNLVNMMEEGDLELQNESMYTALSLAAQAGNIETAKIMMKKNPELIGIHNKRKTPLYLAALFAKPDMVRYLYGFFNKKNGDCLSNENWGWVLLKCVEGDIFDVAIEIVDDWPKLCHNKKLIEKKKILNKVLLALAQKTKAFERKKLNIFLSGIKSIFSVFHVNLWPREKEGELALQLLETICKQIATMPQDDIDVIIGQKRPMDETKKKKKSDTENTNKAYPQIAKMPQDDTDVMSGQKKPENETEKDKKSDTENTNEAYPQIAKMPQDDTDVMSGQKKLGDETEKDKKSDTENTNKAYPRVLFVATKMGNIRFIIKLIHIYPDVIWKLDDKGKTIFHLAIKRRQEKIYNLLYEIGAMKDSITPFKDQKGNNMLHMVAKSAKPTRLQSVSGVALQMQRELLWFKEVENMTPPECRQKKNKAGETPQDLFTKKHADLVSKGENWMKDTSSQCMVVATLIATIAFAAAFTLPGGYDQNTGIPFFRKEPSLIIFVISDAVSLISASTSVLIFLSILTSRYAEHDFLTSLPNKLMTGLATLFLSIVTMMVAFGASFFVLYNKNIEWMPITITSLAAMPVIIFAILQYRLLGDVFDSTYRSRYLFNPKKRVLYC